MAKTCKANHRTMLQKLQDDYGGEDVTFTQSLYFERSDRI